MELGRGPKDLPAKRAVAKTCLHWFAKAGVRIGAHERFGRADLVADHPQAGVFVIEVEGESSRQREQALYSALGQTLLSMTSYGRRIHYGIAVPDTTAWQRQVAKIPTVVRVRLGLHLYLVSPAHVVHTPPISPGA
jgi:hypothetical protein